MAEVESDNLALRLGRLTDVTLQNLTEDYVQLGLAQGSVRVRSYALQTNGAIEVDTANGAFTVVQAGDVRVSSYPGGGQRPDTTIVTVNAGQVHAVGNGMDTTIESGQVLRVDGSNPAQVQLVEMLPQDELDQFDQQRDEQRAQAAGEIRDQYVNPAMVGYDDLTTYGDWAPQAEYGQVWYPRGVEVGWTPYHNGHWAYVAPWGYTWVEAEPWGFAPFHYGRWAQFGGRWGWVPGPPVVRPVYSPALVAFVGGGGISVTAWFPLGPREPFVPWYRASPGYVNRVNVSNLYNRNVVEVRNVYVNRTTNIYVNNRTSVTYVNRSAGMVAVPQSAFERGQPVRGAQVRVDPRQMQQAQVMTRPPEGAARPVGMAPARAVPPVQARTQFPQRGAGMPGGGGQGQRFGQAPVRPVQQQAPVQPVRGQQAAPVQERPAASPTQTQQPGRQDIANPVGGGRNNRPADDGGPKPPVAPGIQLRPPVRQAPSAETPQGQPRVQQEQPQRLAPPVTQARPQQTQPVQRPAPQQQQRQQAAPRAAPAPAPKAEPRKE